MSEQQSLIDQILSGENRQLQALAASGLVPIAPEQLIPIQVQIAEGDDRELADQASTTLKAAEPALASEYLRRHAGERELRWFALHIEQAPLVEAILRRPDVPRPLLVEMAPRLWAEAQETLLLRQDAIIDEPQILVALEGNPQLSSYAKRRIWEYREHLLPRDKVPPKKPEEILAEAEAWTAREIDEAIEEARRRPVEGETVEGVAGLNDGQIRSLAVPVRIRLARGASRQLRAVLVRDTNAQVATAVLNGNQLSDGEIEQIANSRAVHTDVLAEIPKRRDWIRKYTIAKAMVKNPRVPVATALRLLPRMTVNDLRALSRDRNIPHAVRGQAQRLYLGKR